MWCNAGLRPFPPPQKKVNGSSLSAEEQFLIFGLQCREDKTGEEVRLFIREGQQERPATGTQPTGARSESCLPPLNVRRPVFQPISEYKAEVLQSGRCKVSQFCIFLLFQFRFLFNCVCNMKYPVLLEIVWMGFFICVASVLFSVPFSAWYNT